MSMAKGVMREELAELDPEELYALYMEKQVAFGRAGRAQGLEGCAEKGGCDRSEDRQAGGEARRQEGAGCEAGLEELRSPDDGT